jgi:hypothetical protein
LGFATSGELKGNKKANAVANEGLAGLKGGVGGKGLGDAMSGSGLGDALKL